MNDNNNYLAFRWTVPFNWEFRTGIKQEKRSPWRPYHMRIEDYSLLSQFFHIKEGWNKTYLDGLSFNIANFSRSEIRATFDGYIWKPLKRRQ